MPPNPEFKKNNIRVNRENEDCDPVEREKSFL
jgi:hypothetical protein